MVEEGEVARGGRGGVDVKTGAGSGTWDANSMVEEGEVARGGGGGGVDVKTRAGS